MKGKILWPLLLSKLHKNNFVSGFHYFDSSLYALLLSSCSYACPAHSHTSYPLTLSSFFVNLGSLLVLIVSPFSLFSLHYSSSFYFGLLYLFFYHLNPPFDLPLLSYLSLPFFSGAAVIILSVCILTVVWPSCADEYTIREEGDHPNDPRVNSDSNLEAGTVYL